MRDGCRATALQLLHRRAQRLAQQLVTSLGTTSTSLRKTHTALQQAQTSAFPKAARLLLNMSWQHCLPATINKTTRRWKRAMSLRSRQRPSPTRRLRICNRMLQLQRLHIDDVREAVRQLRDGEVESVAGKDGQRGLFDQEN